MNYIILGTVYFLIKQGTKLKQVIKTIQWNIGGAKIRAHDDNPYILKSYNSDGLQDIIRLLKDQRPDIVTLQEIHSDPHHNHAETIAKALGLPYFVSDFYASSHLESGQQLGQGIISRFPIFDHNFKFLHNPKYKAVWEDGSTATSHDKGITKCHLGVNGVRVGVTTLHLIPFKRFGVDPLSRAGASVLNDVQAKLASKDDHLLIQGDFNLNLVRLRTALPSIFDTKTQEIPQTTPTRANGRKIDHVIYRGLQLKESSTINTVLTDHYPIVSTFELHKNI